jgi:hypothetical protein
VASYKPGIDTTGAGSHVRQPQPGHVDESIPRSATVSDIPAVPYKRGVSRSNTPKVVQHESAATGLAETSIRVTLNEPLTYANDLHWPLCLQMSKEEVDRPTGQS